MKLTFIGGAGRLGLAIASWSALRRHDVTIADRNREALAQIREGICPYQEPGIVLGDFALITDDNFEAVRGAELIFVVVPTPSLPDGSFDISLVLDVCRDIALCDGTVVIVSTVNPGDTAGPIRAELGDTRLAYSPEFIKQGSIVWDFANPDQILIGTLDGGHCPALEAYYNSVVVNGAPLVVSRSINVELAKIGTNAALVTKITLANQMAMLCHATPQAEAAAVLSIMGNDHRIGHSFLSPGTWPGGPCLPRDNRALMAAANRKAMSLPLAAATDDFSRMHQLWLMLTLADYLEEGADLLLLGRSYKPEVELVAESQAEILARMIWNVYPNKQVQIYDPVVERGTEDAFEVLVDAFDVIVLMTPHRIFKRIESMDLRGKIVLDMWGFLNERKLNCDQYILFGRGEL